MATPATPRRHANKENIDISSSSSTKGIQWSERVTKIYYSPSPGRSVNIPSSSPTRGPRKSILKATEPLEPLQLEKERDITPQPEDAISDEHFLVWPVATILDEASTLRQLTEAYSVLAARIRSSIPPQLWVSSLAEDQEETEIAHYPLFEPVRVNAESLARAIARDLRRVFVDPYEYVPSTSACPSEVSAESSLPSPRDTPKKGGMTEEQVKFARDLSTVTNSVLKFLTLALHVREVFSCFTEEQLGEILNAALDIPLATSLRSPSARKMYSFTMTLLATQRLPMNVLAGPRLNTRDRVAHALRKAIVGELGREGKKGSVAESLKAVYELAVNRSEIFVPVFLSREFLSALFESLISPALSLRLHAAHAIGGLAYAITQFETCDELRRQLNMVSPIAVEFFLRKQTKPGSSSTILRTIRSALSNQFTDPSLSHHAQAPFWGLSVLTSLTIFLGPAFITQLSVLKEMKEALDLGLKSRKRCVRATTMACWGSLAWIWRTWRCYLPINEPTDHDEAEGDAQSSLRGSQAKARMVRAKETFEKLLNVFSAKAFGTSLVGILLGHPSAEPLSQSGQQDIVCALGYLERTGREGGESTPRVLDALDRLVNGRNAEADGMLCNDEWEGNFAAKLVPRSLLSVYPGLLSTELMPFFQMAGQPSSPGGAASFSAVIESIMKQQPSAEDLRPFSEEERNNGLIWKRVRDVWLGCVEWLQLGVDEPVPDVVLDVWAGVVKMGFSAREGELESSINGFAEQCATILVGILDNANVDLREVSQPSQSSTEGAVDDGSSSAYNMRLKINFVRSLWNVTIPLLPESSIRFAGHEMIKYLLYNYSTLVPPCSDASDADEGTHRAEAMNQWATLLAQVAVALPPEASSSTEKTKDVTLLVWDMLNGDEIGYEWTTEERSAFWRGYARSWMGDDITDKSLMRGEWVWKESCVILGLPFGEYHWDMSDADLSTWNSLLRATISEAEKIDFSVPTVIEYVAEHIDRQHIASSVSTVRIAEYLLSGLDRHIESCGSLPVALVELVHDIMVTSYPPHPRFRLTSQWLIRSLQTVLDACPSDLLVDMLERMQEGICIWVSDECEVFDTEQYSSDVIPLYQMILISLQSLPPTVRILQNLDSYFSSPLQTSKSRECTEALNSFSEFWNDCCKHLIEPKQGWSTGIKQALALAIPSQGKTRSNLMNVPSAPEREVIDLCSDDDDDKSNVVPLTSTPRRRNIALIPLPPSPCNLKTPPKRLSRVAAMRPRRSSIPRPVGNLLQSPSSPSRAVLRMRTTSGSGSPLRNNNGQEKENISPNVVLGKRRVSEDFGSPKNTKKRMIVDLEERRWLSRSPFDLRDKCTVVIGSDDSEEDRAEVDASLSVVEDVERTPFTENNVDIFSIPTSRQSPRKVQAPSVLASPEPAKKRRNDASLNLMRPVKMSRQDPIDDDERSSSPVGPVTPTLSSKRICTYGRQSAAIQIGPLSDDSVLGSSPTKPRKQSAITATTLLCPKAPGLSFPAIIMNQQIIDD